MEKPVVKITCENCGKEAQIYTRKQLSAKHHFCSKKCFGEWQKRQNLNCICPICGQKFHLKPSALKKLKLKACCSKECNRKYRSLYMSGSGNHQYGLKGDKNASFKGQEIVRKNNHQYDIMVYQPEHPYANKNGRVKKHRLIVELNYRKFDCKYFALIDGRYYLKKQYVIHHIDGNHDNNDLGNLKIVTVMEHRHLHNLMSPQPKSRTTGRFIKQTERNAGGFGSTGTR